MFALALRGQYKHATATLRRIDTYVKKVGRIVFPSFCFGILRGQNESLRGSKSARKNNGCCKMIAIFFFLNEDHV